MRLERPANSVFVADPDIADVQAKSSTLVYLFGKSGGETTLFAVGDHDQVALNATIRVRYDTTRIQDAIHELAPRSAVSVSTIGDALVIDGTVHDAAEGDDVRRVAGRYLQDPKQLINRMRVDAPNQINLRVRIAEISRDLIKQMGFNWDAASQGGSFLFGLAAGPNPAKAAILSLGYASRSWRGPPWRPAPGSATGRPGLVEASKPSKSSQRLTPVA